MKKKAILPLLLTGALVLPGTLLQTGCGTSETSAAESGTSQEQEEESGQEQSESAASSMDVSDMFTDQDKEIGYDEENSALITLSGDSASCDFDSVEITEGKVLIREEGTYILSGTLDDGTIVVDAEDTDKIQLVLNGANITAKDCAAIYVSSADKVFVTMTEGSENTLTNGGSYEAIDDNNIDAVIFSKDDLTLNGNGTLRIQAEAGHGVVSKDDLVFTGGTYDIAAASHGISGKDSVRIAAGDFTIVSGKDGVHAENADDAELGYLYIAGGTFSVTAGGDGLSAGSWMLLEDGTYAVTSGGGSAEGETHTEEMGFGQGGGMMKQGRGAMDMNAGMNAEAGEAPQMTGTPEAEATEAAGTDTSGEDVSTKGLKAGETLLISGGSYTLDCADDALHTNGDMTVSGGTFEIKTGDDGMHADNALVISDGTIRITESYEGLEGLSIDITGGEIDLAASDDGLNAAGGTDGSGMMGRGGDMFAVTEGAYIHISGGNLNVNAYGDGLDSNGDLTISGGEVFVSGPENSGNGILDYAGTGTITGGIFVGAGASGMNQNFGDASTQGAVLVSVDAQSAGTAITFADSAGTELISWESEKTYSAVMLSCPELTEGETYVLTAGEVSQEITMDSLIYGSETGMAGAMGGGGRMHSGAEGGMRGGGAAPEMANGEAMPAITEGAMPPGTENGETPAEQPIQTMGTNDDE